MTMRPNAPGVAGTVTIAPRYTEAPGPQALPWFLIGAGGIQVPAGAGNTGNGDMWDTTAGGQATVPKGMLGRLVSIAATFSDMVPHTLGGPGAAYPPYLYLQLLVNGAVVPGWSYAPTTSVSFSMGGLPGLPVVDRTGLASISIDNLALDVPTGAMVQLQWGVSGISGTRPALDMSWAAFGQGWLYPIGVEEGG